MTQKLLLQEVSRQLGTYVEWHPLEHIGTTNQLYTGCYQEQPVVLRLNTGKPVLGVCRQREGAVLNLIGGKAWAPVVLQQQMPDQSQPGWLLIKRYAALDDAPIVDLHSILLACLSDWQQIKDLPLFDYQALWNQYQQKIDDLGGAPQAQMLLDSIRSHMNELMHEPDDLSQAESCLVHHDLHAGNLLSNAGQLIVIDWEYAGLGCPWLDAAALVTAFSISLQAIATLPAFKHINLETVERGVNIAQQINQQLNQLWYEFSGPSHSDKFP